VIAARVVTAAALALLSLALLAPGASARAQYYVSLGDSYATGYQRFSRTTGANTRNAFPNQVVPLARQRGHDLRLVNFGCGGATTTSILRQTTACRGPAVDGPSYVGQTQAGAAERFLRRHRGEVELVTVSIGGNDVTRCVDEADPIPCVGAAVAGINTNLRTLVRRLRAAAGPRVRIVGTTYPDVILGLWTDDNDAARQLAELSVVAFRSIINPALKRQYESVGGRFVDVTATTGAYGSLDSLTRMAPYGVIPGPVARVCRLTYFCKYRDIHATTRGYRIISRLIAETLPVRAFAGRAG
jgi:lysophospholipase L1-like esterase